MSFLMGLIMGMPNHEQIDYRERRMSFLMGLILGLWTGAMVMAVILL